MAWTCKDSLSSHQETKRVAIIAPQLTRHLRIRTPMATFQVSLWPRESAIKKLYHSQQETATYTLAALTITLSWCLIRLRLIAMVQQPQVRIRCMHRATTWLTNIYVTRVMDQVKKERSSHFNSNNIYSNNKTCNFTNFNSHLHLTLTSRISKHKRTY